MDQAFNIAASFVTLLIITTLVLPGRTTSQDIIASGGALTNLTKAGLGQG